jgi:hypothetical protein
VYSSYLQHHKATKDKWWWKVFGQDGVFSIWDFLATGLVRETLGNWSDPNIPEAAIRDANAYCLTITGKPCSLASFINHYAAEYQSVGEVVKMKGFFADPKEHSEWGYKTISSVQNLAGSLLFHSKEWDSGLEWDRPIGWANISMYAANPELQAKLVTNTAQLFAYWGEGNSWIIPSGCVYIRWIGGGRKGTQDLSASCPLAN